MSALKRNIILGLRRLVKGDQFSVHGIDVTVPREIDQEIRYTLARNRPYEAEEAHLTRRYLKQGMNVIEFGGSVGVVSCLTRAQIGPDARQIIVEANPALSKICQANAQRHAIPGAVSVLQMAVDYSGAPKIGFSTGHNAHTGHIVSGDQSDAETLWVPTTTLAKVERELPDGQYVLICDIEGAELELIAAEDFARVDILILETHPDSYKSRESSTQDLIDQLAAKGLSLIERQGDVICFGRDGAV